MNCYSKTNSEGAVSYDGCGCQRPRPGPAGLSSASTICRESAWARQPQNQISHSRSITRRTLPFLLWCCHLSLFLSPPPFLGLTSAYCGIGLAWLPRSISRWRMNDLGNKMAPLFEWYPCISFGDVGWSIS